MSDNMRQNAYLLTNSNKKKGYLTHNKQQGLILTGQHNTFDDVVPQKIDDGIKILGRIKNACVKEFTIEWTQWTVAIFGGIIHHFMISLLLLIISIGSNDTPFIFTGIAHLFKAIAFLSINIALNKYINNHYKQSNKRTFFGHRMTQFLFLIIILSQFLMFVSLPAINFEYWEKESNVAYQCEIDIIPEEETNGNTNGNNNGENCALHVNFIINELILRVFVPITLINIIFKILSILLNKNIHEPSFSGIKIIMHPFTVTFILIGQFLEISLVQSNNISGFNYGTWNIFWIIITSFFIALLLIYTCKSISFEKDNIVFARYRLHSMALLEGVLLISGRIFVIVLLWYEYANKNYVSSRQIVTTAFYIVQIITLKFFRKPIEPNHGKTICFGHLELDFLFYCVIFLNLYNLIWSIIFEIDALLYFLDEGAEKAAIFKIEFSIAFCVLHTDLWALASFMDFAIHSYYSSHGNHNNNMDHQHH